MKHFKIKKNEKRKRVLIEEINVINNPKIPLKFLKIVHEIPKINKKYQIHIEN